MRGSFRPSIFFSKSGKIKTISITYLNARSAFEPVFKKRKRSFLEIDSIIDSASTNEEKLRALNLFERQSSEKILLNSKKFH